MRLMDADALGIDKCNPDVFENKGYADGWNSAISILKDAPTAFDVDKVIGKLNELKTYKLNLADAMSELMKRDKLGAYVCLEDVVGVIKESIE